MLKITIHQTEPVIRTVDLPPCQYNYILIINDSDATVNIFNSTDFSIDNNIGSCRGNMVMTFPLDKSLTTVYIVRDATIIAEKVFIYFMVDNPAISAALAPPPIAQTSLVGTWGTPLMTFGQSLTTSELAFDEFGQPTFIFKRTPQSFITSNQTISPGQTLSRFIMHASDNLLGMYLFLRISSITPPPAGSTGLILRLEAVNPDGNQPMLAETEQIQNLMTRIILIYPNAMLTGGITHAWPVPLPPQFAISLTNTSASTIIFTLSHHTLTK